MMDWKRTSGAAGAVGLAAIFVLLANFPAAHAEEAPGWQILQPAQHQPSEASRPNAPGTVSSPSATTGGAAAPGQPTLQGSFPRSFVIPGTNTSIRFGGTIDETLKYRPQ